MQSTSIEVCIDVPEMNARSAKLNLGRNCCKRVLLGNKL